MSEHSDQCAIFEWVALNEGRLPELGLLFHVPNGGKRDKVTAARLKAEGVKPVCRICFCQLPGSVIMACGLSSKSAADASHPRRRNGTPRCAHKAIALRFAMGGNGP